MQIAHLGPHDLGSLRQRDTVDILIPNEAAELCTTFRAGRGCDRTAFVRSPLVLIIPPGLAHSLSDRRGSRTLILSIDGAFFAEAARRLDGEDVSLVEPHATTDSLVRAVGMEVDREYLDHHQPTANYIDSLAAVLAVHIARAYGTESGPLSAIPGGLAAHKLQSTRTFISDHLAETILVDQLAEAAHLSPFHFARLFKQSTGHSPHLYIVMERIKRAKELLAGSELALFDVSADVGFRTQGHFTGVFHRYTGVTPRVYRLNARQRAAPTSAGS